MRALLRHDLLRDGRTPPCSDATAHMMARANELHVRDGLKKLTWEGTITRYEEKRMPTRVSFPDSIAITSSRTCTFPNRSTLIIAMDSDVNKMYETINDLEIGRMVNVSALYISMDSCSAKYNVKNDVLEVPAMKGSGPGAFVISNSRHKEMNAHNINLSYTSKCIEQRHASYDKTSS